MLTKNDLQQIRSVIREEVREQLDPVQSDVASLKSDMGGLKSDVGSLKKDMKVVKKKVSKIEKTVDVMINHFNRDDMRLNKRVTRIERHLSLPPVD